VRWSGARLACPDHLERLLDAALPGLLLFSFAVGQLAAVVAGLLSRSRA
jgi:hypothetical protein